MLPGRAGGRQCADPPFQRADYQPQAHVGFDCRAERRSLLKLALRRHPGPAVAEQEVPIARPIFQQRLRHVIRGQQPAQPQPLAMLEVAQFQRANQIQRRVLDTFAAWLQRCLGQHQPCLGDRLDGFNRPLLQQPLFADDIRQVRQPLIQAQALQAQFAIHRVNPLAPQLRQLLAIGRQGAPVQPPQRDIHDEQAQDGKAPGKDYRQKQRPDIEIHAPARQEEDNGHQQSLERRHPPDAPGHAAIGGANALLRRRQQADNGRLERAAQPRLAPRQPLR